MRLDGYRDIIKAMHLKDLDENILFFLHLHCPYTEPADLKWKKRTDLSRQTLSLHYHYLYSAKCGRRIKCHPTGRVNAAKPLLQCTQC